MHKSLRALSAVCLSTVLLFSSCTAKTPSSSDTTPTQSDTTTTAAVTASSQAVNTTLSEEDTSSAFDRASATVITLENTKATVQGEGASVRKAVVTIEKGGCYVVSGTLKDGQLRVESNDAHTVHIVLDGATIHSNTTAPVFIKRAAKAVLTLATGSENTLSDSADAVPEDTENDEPSGTLFSKADLSINGEGTLVVNAAYRDGIVSRDGLKLCGGKVAVTAADDAVMGRDYVLMADGAYDLTAEGDGVKSTNDGGDTVGFVEMIGGTLTVVSGAHGVQAQTALTVSGGALDITSGGGAAQGTANTAHDFGWGTSSTDTQTSGKGLKAGTAITVSGATVAVNAADDGVHANDRITVSGGQTTVAAGDDGVHADNSLTITGGTLTVSQSYEALEAGTVTLQDGTVSLTASDDGINASKGSEGSTGDRGMNDPFALDDSALIIEGGTLYVDASGDGLDSNGTITMNGGTVSVCGPSNSGNGTFDFGAGFLLNGGTLIGIGSMGMAETPTQCAQNSVIWGGCALQSGDTVSVTSASGEELVSLVSSRTAEWMFVSAPTLKAGDTIILSDGSSEQTVTLSEGETTVGTVSGGMGGGPGGMGGGPGGGHRPGDFMF